MPPPDEIKAELIDPKSLTACIAQMGAPASSLDADYELSGYNVAFADEIADRLGVKSVIRDAQFSELVSMLESHECDIAVSSQNITAERSTQINLVPYTQAKLGFPVVVGKGNPLGIASLDDLCGLTVSATAGTTNVDFVNGNGDFSGRGLTDTCATNVQPAPVLKTYPSELAALQALINGDVAAYLGNSNFASQPQFSGLVETSAATLPGSRQGIGIALDHPNLTTAVKSTLGAMMRDGTYLQILSQYIATQSVDNFSVIQ
jgi:polar amino acid transport system substrate-binding protein